MCFDELTLPDNESSIFSSSYYLTIREFIEGGNIGQVELTKLGNLILEFQTCESLGHFPELDVSLTACE
jgi:hypothetical protein